MHNALATSRNAAKMFACIWGSDLDANIDPVRIKSMMVRMDQPSGCSDDDSWSDDLAANQSDSNQSVVNDSEDSSADERERDRTKRVVNGSDECSVDERERERTKRDVNGSDEWSADECECDRTKRDAHPRVVNDEPNPNDRSASRAIVRVRSPAAASARKKRDFPSPRRPNVDTTPKTKHATDLLDQLMPLGTGRFGKKTRDQRLTLGLSARTETVRGVLGTSAAHPRGARVEQIMALQTAIDTPDVLALHMAKHTAEKHTIRHEEMIVCPDERRTERMQRGGAMAQAINEYKQAHQVRVAQAQARVTPQSSSTA